MFVTPQFHVCVYADINLQDPVGGAQAAGSWAVRETFVAVVVCNLPLVYQGIRRMIKTASGSRLYSRSASRMGYNKSTDEPDFEMVQAQAPAPRLSMPEFDARQEHQQHEFFKAP